MALHTKMLTFTLLILILVTKTLSLAVQTNEQTVTPKQELQKSVIGYNWSYYNVAALGTAILVVGAGLAALMSLFLPVMTFKLCLMLGGCQNTIDSYVDQLIREEPPSRQKRSVDYIEPLLNALATAYENYADEDVKKKSKILRSLTK